MRVMRMKTIDDLVKFFNAIPESEWIMNYLCKDSSNPTTKQPGCALGHLNFHFTGDYSGLNSEIRLDNLGIDTNELIHANNGYSSMMHFGDTPKIRVINFLEAQKNEPDEAI